MLCGFTQGVYPVSHCYHVAITDLGRDAGDAIGRPSRGRIKTGGRGEILKTLHPQRV